MDIRALYSRAVDSTWQVVETLSDDQLALPTPCARWTAREIVEHMVENHHNILTKFDKPVPELTGDVRTDFRRTADAVIAAFTDDRLLETRYEIPQGTVNGAIALGIHFSDTLVHGWDLGQAVDTEVRLADDLAEALIEIVSRWPEDVWGPDGVFAERLPVEPDAPLHDRVLALTGRSPEWAGR
ncbi:TIGR03086 family metal-binding protein [Actinokineospora sp. NBRC 105648]|uniref:TIGR03086 family metal-binding protein n=1 Tax=Actinokineospora sp. NBRC 105648 TaxID=3032206 RepID=UPI0024A02360|nr:TIGR03086 family metal-binding protein [Actinokineospora sp. NBRC 105648]GLZ41760.1 TIGR03086 family protein [Actinokineospora sp. NBRC 105648]